MLAGADTYVDPRSGFSVMTAAGLSERGWCCDNGCRHCPYTGTTDKAAWRTWAAETAGRIDTAAVGERIRDHLRPVLQRVTAQPGRVLVYRALTGEIDLGPLVDALGAEHFALTRTPPTGPLTVHGAEGVLERHRHGFEQPTVGAPAVDKSRISMVLLPGMAFDLRGVRLGHGGGYYDRLLPTLAPDAPRLGVIAGALVVPELPAEDHDVTVTHLVTEDGITAPRPPPHR